MAYPRNGLQSWLNPYPFEETQAEKDRKAAEAALEQTTPSDWGFPSGYVKTVSPTGKGLPSTYIPPQPPPTPTGDGTGMPSRYETITEGGWVFSVGYDAQGNIVSRDPLGRAETPTVPETISPYQQAQLTWQEQQAAQQQAWQQQQQAYQQQQDIQAAAYQQQQMNWYREQAAAQAAEQERQYRAQLAASPMSWLQYASYTGEQPVVQPWMIPLMGQQYAGTVAGQQIPGWQGKGMSMANLPGLTTPSMQYWARMGPTGQQQMLGYGQAQGGIRPEETQFRLQSQAPPGGRNYGLTWGR